VLHDGADQVRRGRHRVERLRLADHRDVGGTSQHQRVGREQHRVVGDTLDSDGRHEPIGLDLGLGLSVIQGDQRVRDACGTDGAVQIGQLRHALHADQQRQRGESPQGPLVLRDDEGDDGFSLAGANSERPCSPPKRQAEPGEDVGLL
jgi:hypothetical protein